MVRRRRRVLLVFLLLSVVDAFVVEKARFVVDVDLRRVLRSVGLRVNAYNIYICIMLKVLKNELRFCKERYRFGWRYRCEHIICT